MEKNSMDEMYENSHISETDDRREIIKQKLRQYYDGRIVHKDLTKSIREGAMYQYMFWNIFLDNIATLIIRRLLMKE